MEGPSLNGVAVRQRMEWRARRQTICPGMEDGCEFCNTSLETRNSIFFFFGDENNKGHDD